MDTDVRREAQIPSPYEQLLEIRTLKSQPMEEGDIWYLVSKLWYERWGNACMGRVSKDSVALEAPGPVDNSDITQCAPHPGKDYDLILIPPVIEGETAEFIPKSAFDKLVRWCAIR
jgi:ubiquitin carboxyl-terminal hydrolase 4/11/15